MNKNGQTKSLSQKAYDVLEEMIVTLELEPGRVYSESELSDLAGFGRTPLRESLQRLAGYGLIEMIPRRGVQIANIDFNRQLALLETRRVLDELMATRAARRATEDQRKKLGHLAKLMETAAQDGNIQAYLRLDKEFDELIDRASRNEFAARALEPLHIHCRRFWSFYNVGPNLRVIATLHEKLMLAVADGDEDRAAGAANELVDYLVNFTRKALELV